MRPRQTLYNLIEDLQTVEFLTAMHHFAPRADCRWIVIIDIDAHVNASNFAALLRALGESGDPRFTSMVSFPCYVDAEHPNDRDALTPSVISRRAAQHIVDSLDAGDSLFDTPELFLRVQMDRIGIPSVECFNAYIFNAFFAPESEDAFLAHNYKALFNCSAMNYDAKCPLRLHRLNRVTFAMNVKNASLVYGAPDNVFYGTSHDGHFLCVNP
jgi:hypothetical protein